MKKLIVYFLLFVFIHVFFVSNTFAIFDKRTQFPGISCGVAGAKKTTASADDATKCCTY